jgi:hypothetical protein
VAGDRVCLSSTQKNSAFLTKCFTLIPGRLTDSLTHSLVLRVLVLQCSRVVAGQSTCPRLHRSCLPVSNGATTEHRSLPARPLTICLTISCETLPRHNVRVKICLIEINLVVFSQVGRRRSRGATLPGLPPDLPVVAGQSASRMADRREIAGAVGWQIVFAARLCDARKRSGSEGVERFF